MDYEKLAELIFPDVKETVQDLEKRFPKRNLKENAQVTRFAPSPTGYMHIGGLYAGLISSKFAKQSEGVFYLRIEDTDKKRELEGGVSEIINALKVFGINFDEGPFDGGEYLYAPYKQSERKDIYHICAKELMKKGFAYPCFAAAEDLEEIRKTQEEAKIDIGYYGEYAKSRNLSYEEIKENIEKGKEYVVRLKSPGKPENRIIYHDDVRGEIEMPENFMDIVLLKSDGIPTYHFAHTVDDHFMRTTLVVRGDEWLSSYPIHKQLFEVCGFEKVDYVHIAPIMKMDGSSKRKLSKRKDPEAGVNYYVEQGFPKEAVIEYLFTIANSNYEEWRMANPDKSNDEFKLTLEKMTNSGALFDIVKLTDISKEVISKKSVDECYENIKEWSAVYDKNLNEFAVSNEEMFKETIKLWKFNNGKVRKDIAKWSELSVQYDYLYSNFEKLAINYEFDEKYTKDQIKEVILKYLDDFYIGKDANAWFEKMKELGTSLGYCANMKEYKKNKEAYKGSVADVCGILRVAVTGRKNSPDLYTILTILGENEVKTRLKLVL